MDENCYHLGCCLSRKHGVSRQKWRNLYAPFCSDASHFSEFWKGTWLCQDELVRVPWVQHVQHRQGFISPNTWIFVREWWEKTHVQSGLWDVEVAGPTWTWCWRASRTGSLQSTSSPSHLYSVILFSGAPVSPWSVTKQKKCLIRSLLSQAI